MAPILNMRDDEALALLRLKRYRMELKSGCACGCCGQYIDEVEDTDGDWVSWTDILNVLAKMQ